MQTLVFNTEITEQYKKVSELMNNMDQKADHRKKSLRAIMEESFFHGASKFGYNFIA